MLHVLVAYVLMSVTPRTLPPVVCTVPGAVGILAINYSQKHLETGSGRRFFFSDTDSVCKSRARNTRDTRETERDFVIESDLLESEPTVPAEQAHTTRRQ